MNDAHRQEGIPLVFDIRRLAMDDGPGIRTTVFFKGCPLFCSWCHNPESIKNEPELAFDPSRCIRCGNCFDVCSKQAIIRQNELRIDRLKCDACGICVDSCPTGALQRIGKYYTATELVAILMRDKAFYDASGGGVTFSGGEPTLHMGYLRNVMEKLKDHKIHIAIQTCGFFNLYDFERILSPFIDVIYYDIKVLNEKLHVKHTGFSNKIIINNFISLIKNKHVSIVPRVPLIPRVSDTKRNLDLVERFFGELGVTNYVFLPFNSMGTEKRKLLQ